MRLSFTSTDFDVGFLVIAALIVFALLRAHLANARRNQARYEARAEFLSAAERSFFGVLQQAVSSDFVILAKVRLADIVHPAKNPSHSAWQSAFNRISAKHVDFVLCDPQRLTVQLVIELDDRSHGTLKSGARDSLVDSALADARIPILRVPARHSYAPLQLREQIDSLLGRSTESVLSNER